MADKATHTRNSDSTVCVWKWSEFESPDHTLGASPVRFLLNIHVSSGWIVPESVKLLYVHVPWSVKIRAHKCCLFMLLSQMIWMLMGPCLVRGSDGCRAPLWKYHELFMNFPWTVHMHTFMNYPWTVHEHEMAAFMNSTCSWTLHQFMNTTCSWTPAVHEHVIHELMQSSWTCGVHERPFHVHVQFMNMYSSWMATSCSCTVHERRWMIILWSEGGLPGAVHHVHELSPTVLMYWYDILI